MRYYITSNLKNLLKKNMFSARKNWTHFERIGNSVHTAEFLALGKALNIYVNYSMFYRSRQHVKLKHFKYTISMYKFTFNDDFMMNRELNFSVTRNYFGHVLICWWVTLFSRLSYWRQVVEMNFSSIQLISISCWTLSFPVS